eukprot:6490651-Amphidinium_carterae.2
MVVTVSGVVTAVTGVSGGVASGTVTVEWTSGSEHWGGAVECVGGACGAVLESLKWRGCLQLSCEGGGAVELWTVCDVTGLDGAGVGEGKLGGMGFARFLPLVDRQRFVCVFSERRAALVSSSCSLVGTSSLDVSSSSPSSSMNA